MSAKQIPKHGGVWSRHAWATKQDLQEMEARLVTQLRMIMITEQDILDDVTSQTTVIDSAVTLLGHLSDLIKQAGTDPVKLQAIRDLITNQKTKLADAVVANTPAAPPA